MSPWFRSYKMLFQEYVVLLRKSYPRRLREDRNKSSKVHFIRYADDLIATAYSKEILLNNIIPAINEFLKPRGLMLSPEKTRILRLEEGFDFLGQHISRKKDRLLITPSKENAKSFLSKVRTIIKSCHGWKTEDMIRKLNPVIRGWAYYHRFIHSYRVFWIAGKTIFQALQRWMRRRHPENGYGWLIKNYFNNPNRKWGFTCYIKDRSGKRKLLELIQPSYIKIVQYIKIKGASNPFDLIYGDYFKMRRKFNNYRSHQTNNLAAGLQ